MFIDPVEAFLVEDVEVLGKGRIMTLGTYGHRIDQRMNFLRILPTVHTSGAIHP